MITIRVDDSWRREKVGEVGDQPTTNINISHACAERPHSPGEGDERTLRAHRRQHSRAYSSSTPSKSEGGVKQRSLGTPTRRGSAPLALSQGRALQQQQQQQHDQLFEQRFDVFARGKNARSWSWPVAQCVACQGAPAAPPQSAAGPWHPPLASPDEVRDRPSQSCRLHKFDADERYNSFSERRHLGATVMVVFSKKLKPFVMHHLDAKLHKDIRLFEQGKLFFLREPIAQIARQTSPRPAPPRSAAPRPPQDRGARGMRTSLPRPKSRRSPGIGAARWAAMCAPSHFPLGSPLARRRRRSSTECSRLDRSFGRLRRPREPEPPQQRTSSPRWCHSAPLRTSR